MRKKKKKNKFLKFGKAKENLFLGGASMQLSKMKNIIVLKGMSSNVVQEAIVVLKPNVKLKQSEYNTKGKMNHEDKNKKMIVMKEAENTIHNYVKKLQKENCYKEEIALRKKYRFLQVCNVFLISSIIIATLILA